MIARRIESVEPGLYHYAPLTRALERLRLLEIPDAVLTQLFLDQSYVANTAAIFVISAFLHRSMHKYLDRGYRYVLLEAGHVAQNLNLASTALELGSFNLGGFFDGFLAQLFALDLEQEVPLYAVALGQPASADRIASRLAEGVL